MKFAVAIDAPSRYSRPPFGRFAYVQSQGRLVWRKEGADDIARLVELANEAIEFLRGMNGSYKLGIYPWKAESETPKLEETLPPPVEPIPDETPQPPLDLEEPKPEVRKLKRKT